MIRKLIRSLVPDRLEWSIKKMLYSRPGGGHYCPICESRVRRFRSFGPTARVDACCPVCRSVERHRLVWSYIVRRSALFDGPAKKMLHIAPEKCIEKRLRSCPGLEYLTADLLDPRAMIRLDITDICFPDASFDVICCSHVLEHVVDDRQAMREMRRVLKPGGTALFMVPFRAGATDEDPGVTDPDERTRRFGQPDHVRFYGEDFAARLLECGFRVEEVRATDLFADEEIERQRLLRTDAIFVCTP